MQLFFIPFACSLAARIALEEAGLDADYVHVVPHQPLDDGGDFLAISPMGYVPALRIADGTVLTEGPAVLQYIADLAPESGLAPAPSTAERYKLQVWLNFISTEIHKGVFAALMSKKATEGAREWSRALLPARFDLLAAHLDEREYLLDGFTVADAYLLAILNWCEHAGVDIAGWPALVIYRARIRQRPSVARAMAAELPLLRAA